MKKFLLLILVFCFCVNCVFAVTNPSDKYKRKIENSSVASQGKINNVYQSTSQKYSLGYNAKAYFAAKSIIRTNPDKQVVFYESSFDSSCPYSVAFSKKMKSIITNPEYNKYYEFKTLSNISTPISYMPDKDYYRLKKSGLDTRGAIPESKARVILEFDSKCSFLCIFDKNYDLIYTVGDSIGMKEINALPRVFESLK